MPMKVIPMPTAVPKKIGAKINPKPTLGLRELGDTFNKEVSTYRDFDTTEELNLEGLSELRDDFYHEYLLKLGFCKKEDMPRIQKNILRNLTNKCQGIPIPPDIEPAKLIAVIKKEVVEQSAKSQILYELMELNFQKTSATDALKDQEEKLVYLQPGSEEWTKSNECIKRLNSIIDEQNSRINNYSAACDKFKNENLLRPMRLRSSIIWLNGNETDTEAVKLSILELADKYWIQLLEEIAPFEDKEVTMQYVKVPYNKLYSELKEIPGDNIYDSRKKVADSISKAFLDVLLNGETKKDGKKVKSYVDQFRQAFGKVNEISERILTLAVKRDEYPVGSKDWHHFNNALIEARKDRETAIMKNRGKLSEKDIDPGLYFQWMESNRYDLAPAAFFEFQRNEVMDKIAKLTGKSWTAAKKLLKYLQSTELPKIDKAWQEARNNNLKILEANGVKDLTDYQKEFLREKL